MADRMINQRPADQQGGGGIEERGLARRSEPRGLTRYEGWSSPFELMRRFSEDVDRMFSSFGFGNFGWPFERTGRCRQRQMPESGQPARKIRIASRPPNQLRSGGMEKLASSVSIATTPSTSPRSHAST